MVKRVVFRMTEIEYQEHCDSYNGVCIACSRVRYGNTEGDASDYECDYCGETKVIGIENALMEGFIEFTGEEDNG